MRRLVRCNTERHGKQLKASILGNGRANRPIHPDGKRQKHFQSLPAVLQYVKPKLIQDISTRLLPMTKATPLCCP